MKVDELVELIKSTNYDFLYDNTIQSVIENRLRKERLKTKLFNTYCKKLITINIVAKEGVDGNMVADWLGEYVGNGETKPHRYRFMEYKNSHYMFFENSDDAVKFKLRWA